jgi:hypothetical protein
MGGCMAGVKGNTGRQGLGTASLMKFRANAFRINDNLCLVKHAMANPVYSSGPDFSTMEVFQLRAAGYDSLQKFLLFLNGLN